jgi:apolipoprotein N-acyltransferase
MFYYYNMSRIFRYILSVSSGVLLSLAWLGFPGWILFVAFIPLLQLDRFFTENRNNYKGVYFWGHTFLAFLIWNALCTWWIAHATFIGAVMAIVVNSFLMSLVWWIGHIARRNFRSNLGYITLVVFWISFEFFHFHWDIEWPWLNLGNGFANNVKIVQWYEYTGILGGTLWILIMNILIFTIYQSIKNKSPVRRIVFYGVFIVIFLTIPLTISFISYHSYTEEPDPVDVVIVQPNIDPYAENYDQRAEIDKLNKFLKLANSATDEQTDIVVGPETVFERYFDWNVDQLENNFQFDRIYAWMQNYPDAEVIFGASTSKIYKDEEISSPTARSSRGLYYDVFNSAVFIGRDSKGQLYHKSILVSGVEKMPFRKYLGFLNDFVFNLGGTTGSLGRQEEPSNFVMDDGNKVAPVICYESVFGEYLSRSVKKGAGLIIVITNDGWWKDTPGYRQHLSFSRLRAIENRRSIVRAANTGISCFISQRGDILKSAGWNKAIAISGVLNYNYEMTFYMKYGDYIARMSLFISVLLLLYFIIIPKKNPHQFRLRKTPV